MPSVQWGYLALAVFFVLVSILVVINRYPVWLQSSYGVIELIIEILVVAVGLFAAFREAFFKDLNKTGLPPILKQLPTIQVELIGRDQELRNLRDVVKKDNKKVLGLFGMGGVGKTLLGLKLALLLKKDFRDGQIFIDLKGASDQPALTTEQIMTHVIFSFFPEAPIPTEPSRIRALYQNTLHQKNALLFFDNALDLEQVSPLVSSETCLLIVTSRQHIDLDSIYSYEITTLLPENAHKLLLSLSSRIGEQTKEIAKLCGYLPLALRLAASVLNERPDLDPTAVAERLKDGKGRLMLIEASIDLSYDLLSEDLKLKWRKLAIFPGAFSSEAVAEVWEVDKEQAKDVLWELRAYSLVEWDETAKRYHLHDLIKVGADSKLNGKEREGAGELHAKHFCSVLNTCRELLSEGKDSVVAGLSMFDLERLNIEGGHAWAIANQTTNAEAAKLVVNYPNAGVYVLSLRLLATERIEWLSAAVSAAEKMSDVRAKGFSLGNLGLAYVALGETRKAIEYHEQALAIRREIGDRHGEGIDLGNLGVAYAALGQTRKAIEYYEQRLIIAHEIGDRSGEGYGLGNLGLAYAALGETRKAIEHHKQALAISREIGDRHGESSDLGNLGLAYAALGETRKAIDHYEQALAISREIGDRRGESSDLDNMGSAYANLGETHKAIEYYEQALAISREIGDRNGEGIDLGNLGIAYAALGQIRKALGYFEQALAISRKIGNRRGEGGDLGNVGSAYANLGETRKAIEYYEKQLVIVREIGDRRGEGNALWNKALALESLGARSEAVSSAKLALTIYKEIEHPSTEQVRQKLAFWQENKK